MTEFSLSPLNNLPAGWTTTAIGRFRQQRSQTFNPGSAREASYELYSVPSHATGKPEIVSPAEIGSNKQHVAPGDVLISKINPRLNRTWTVGEMGALTKIASTEWVVFPRSEVLDPRFLKRLLSDYRLRDFLTANGSGVGGSLTRIRPDLFDKIETPLPPLNEQRRIVEKIEAMFDEIDKGVESLHTARTTLGLYRQSLLKSAFEGRLTADWRAKNADKLEAPETLIARIQKERDTRYKAALDTWQDALTKWRADGEKGKRPAKPRRDAQPDAPMSEQSALMNGIPTEWQWLQIGIFGFVTKLAGFEYTKHVTYRDDGDLPVIKAENAGKSGFKITDYSKVRSEEVAMLTRSFLNGGELLMVFVGAGTGQVATVPSDQRYFLGPNIGMIRLETPDILPKFVEHYLRSPIGTSMKLASVKAVAQPSLSMGTIRQIPVAIPSPAEQAEIVRILDARLEAADALEAEIDAALTRADALRQSILKKAFSGHLVPQDPTDEPASTLLARIKADRAKVPETKKRRSAHA